MTKMPLTNILARTPFVYDIFVTAEIQDGIDNIKTSGWIS